MSEVLYPWGYAKRMVDITELKRLARFDLMDPESAERLEAWLISRGGYIGIGGAFRIVQPDKTGFAPDGASFHQLQTFNDDGRNFCAVDLVCVNGENVHRAPRWDEVPRQGSGHPDISDYGVHCNVNGEPWHMQPIEIDGHKTWIIAGRRRPNPNFPIKQAPTPTPPPVLPVPTPTPPPTPTPTPVPDPLPAISPGERTLRLTSPQMAGWDVLFVQKTVKEVAGQQVDLDGYYGPATEQAVKNVQAWFKLTADGIVGPNTWKLMIDLSKPPDPNHHEIGSRTLRLASPTMHGSDVLWVQNQIAKHMPISADGYYGKQTRDKVMIAQGWNKLTQDGVVGPQTWEMLKKF